MKDQVEALIKSVCRKLYGIEDANANLIRPELQFGDYATYVSFDLATVLHKSPKDIAGEIVEELKSDLIEKAEVAGPGFINLSLSNSALARAYAGAMLWDKANEGQQQLVEFGDPNPFKEMHLGHLYTSVVGDSIARLLEAGGAKVVRLSYHGDVGPQVAKCIWGIGNAINWDISKLERAINAEQLGKYYADGAKAFDSDKTAESEIREINEHVYRQDDDKINAIYTYGKDISFQRFDDIFKQIDVHFDKQYFESESGPVGVKTVDKNIGKVFTKSEGAVVFKGEKVGLHTRVFINSRGLPTYEAKDLGLVELKYKDYPEATLSLIITGNEQSEYFKVMLAALNEINPELARITKHLTHGFLSLTTGKMSSRSGDVYGADKLLSEVEKAVASQYPDTKVKDEIFKAAVRYTFLKQKIGTNIVFDTKESVSLEGNSGPYIQYAHARGQSILSKVVSLDHALKTSLKVENIPLQPSERSLASKISEYPEVVTRAIDDFMPHHICIYLYELAQEFNRFYEKNRVIDDPRMLTRIDLVKAYTKVLQSGLELLNIPAPVQM